MNAMRSLDCDCDGNGCWIGSALGEVTEGYFRGVDQRGRLVCGRHDFTGNTSNSKRGIQRRAAKVIESVKFGNASLDNPVPILKKTEEDFFLTIDLS